jgi:Flp pilus assembly protein TadG
VEFAIVGSLLALVTFAVVETGLLWWLKSGMQLTASLTARCGAIGYTYKTANFVCIDATTTKNYAVATSQSWLFPNMIVAANVTPSTVASCHGFTGNFFSVVISSSFFSALPPPLGNYATLATSACYPMQ